MYQNLLKHNYAYMLDSNANLAYNSTMFTSTGENVNNRGLRTIMNDTKKLIVNLITETYEENDDDEILHNKTSKKELFRE